MGKFPTDCIYTDTKGSLISPKIETDLSALKHEDCKLVAVYKKLFKLRKRKSSSPVGLWSKYVNSDENVCIKLSDKVTKTLWQGTYCRPHMPLNPLTTYSKAREQVLVEYVSYCIVEKNMNVILLQESFKGLNYALYEKFEDFLWNFKPDLTI